MARLILTLMYTSLILFIGFKVYDSFLSEKAPLTKYIKEIEANGSSEIP